MRTRFFVDVSHLSADEMQFYGFTVLNENDEFILYGHYSGNEHLVAKARPYVYVDDVNDAVAMGSKTVVSW